MSDEEQQSVSSQKVTVSELAEALLRLRLPETEKILRHTAFSEIETDHGRQDVAIRLATISRRHQQGNQLKEVVNQLNTEMGGLDPALLNCLVFMSRASERWQQQSPLDSAVKKELLKRRFTLAALLMDQPEFALDRTHPVSQLLAAVEKLFMGWEENQGKPPIFVSKSLAAFTRFIDADHCLIREEQELARDTLYQQWEKERKRRDNLEKRQIQTEIGKDNARVAQLNAKATIHKYADGLKLPVPVIQLFEGVWLDLLRTVALTAGTLDSQYIRLTELTGKIIFCFQDEHPQDQKQKLFDWAGHIVDDVSEQICQHGILSDANDQLLSNLNALMIEILKGTDVARKIYRVESVRIPSSYDAKAPDEEQLSVYRGAWFRRFDKVCKFLAVLPKSQQILWSDFNGRKAGLEDYSTFIAELEGDEMVRFDGQVRIHDLFFAVAEEIVQLDKKIRLQQQQQLELEKEVKQAAKLKAEAEANAIIKSRAEAARKLAQERKDLEERLQREAVEADERNRLLEEKSARADIDGLPVGGWVLLAKNDEQIKCKLGVRLNATGRLIFVDNFGMKMAEMMRDEAVERVLANKLEILGESADFEDRLSRAVGRIGIAKR